jgi:hypothetical protein
MIAKVRKWIVSFQVTDPIKHEFDAVFCVRLESVSERFPYSAERWCLLTQVQDEKNTEKSLRPAKKVWYEALLP